MDERTAAELEEMYNEDRRRTRKATAKRTAAIIIFMIALSALSLLLKSL